MRINDIRKTTMIRRADNKSSFDQTSISWRVIKTKLETELEMKEKLNKIYITILMTYLFLSNITIDLIEI